MNEYINKVLKDTKAASCGVVIVEKGKVIFKGGFGYRDVENKLPANENSMYAIGSSTKAFTCTLIGQLAYEKKIDLDKPAADYLPSLRFSKSDLTANVTPRDMMCHRTGLPRHDYSWIGSKTTRDSLIKRISSFETSAPLRSKWQYNNFMFTSLGGMVQEVTGKTWEKLLDEKIFGPLSMTNTNSNINGLKNASNGAIPYYLEKDSISLKANYMDLDNMGPAGSINSTAADISNWLLAWINDGKANGKQIIPAAYRLDAMTAQMAMGGLVTQEQPDVHFANYGLGWMLSSYRGHYRVEHGGNVTGYTSSVGFFPADSIGIAVFVNQNRSAANGIIRNYIADKMMGLTFTDWNAKQLERQKKAIEAKALALKALDSLTITNTKPTHTLAEYVGNYVHPGYGDTKITKQGDTLIAIYNNYRMVLKHKHYDVFTAYADDHTFDNGEGMPLKFNTGYNGEIESLSNASFEPTLKEIIFKKGLSTIKVEKADLEKYVGDYELMGTVIKVYLKDGLVMVKVPGQPDYEGIPTKTNEFALKGIDGYSVRFDVSAKNIVTAVNFVQPNGTFKAVKK
jgi:CubicO group peptidase (beta-lactamase class C family)